MKATALGMILALGLSAPALAASTSAGEGTTCKDFTNMSMEEQETRAEAIKLEVEREESTSRSGHTSSEVAMTDEQMMEKVKQECEGSPDMQVSDVFKSMMKDKM
jgi:hypothetical protein